MGNNKGWGSIPKDDDIFEIERHGSFPWRSAESFKAFGRGYWGRWKRNISIYIFNNERSLDKVETNHI